jgi:ribonuclease Z
MIRVTFLGTAAARPTVGRNVSGIALQREGDLFLFDCGEGTQRQMMRFGSGFGVQGIFITHLHADHFLGVVGLIRTLGLQGREEPLSLYGPPGSEGVLRDAVHLGVDRLPFPVHFREMSPGDSVEFGEYEVAAFQALHGTPAIGFALRELPRLGRFDPDRARALGVPEGPLFGRLHKGESIKVGGRVIDPAEVVGEPRPGRLLVYTGDSRPTGDTRRIAEGADVLIHEATFTEDEADRAHSTFHSTARGAAQVALDASVHRLILTHISARYANDPAPLLEEAKRVFPSSTVAHDGLSFELGYRADESEVSDVG